MRLDFHFIPLKIIPKHNSQSELLRLPRLSQNPHQSFHCSHQQFLQISLLSSRQSAVWHRCEQSVYYSWQCGHFKMWNPIVCGRFCQRCIMAHGSRWNILSRHWLWFVNKNAPFSHYLIEDLTNGFPFNSQSNEKKSFPLLNRQTFWKVQKNWAWN